MTSTPQARRNGLFVLFALSGIVMSSWVSRTPDIRDLIGVTTAEMGLVLMGLSGGSMLGVLMGGPLVARFGARKVTLVTATLIAIGPAVLGVGAGLHQAGAVALGLGIFGLGMGAAEIGLNVEGGEVEAALGRSTLPLLHGAYSLATTIGAAIGMALTAIGFPVATHLIIVSGIVLVALFFAIRPMPADVGIRTGSAQASAPRPQVWRDPRLLLVCVIVLALAMAEGTATDWLPLLMVDGHGFSATLGSGVYAIFALTMTIGRFSGGWFVDRFGQAAVLGASAVIGAIGLALVAFVDNPVLAAASVVLWGLGAANGFPVAISAAGSSGPDSTARVSLAASIGYVAFLVGPPLLGFLGEHYGLRNAIVVVLVMVSVAVVATLRLGAANRKQTSGEQVSAS